MTGRAKIAVTLFVFAPVGIATWILAAFTIGEQLDPRTSPVIGLAVALLAVATVASLTFFVSGKPGKSLSLVLVICGTCCIVAAVLLQVYLAAVTAQNSRRIMEILGEHMQTNPSASLNVNADYPKTVQVVSYLAIFAGIWMAAVGTRLGIGSNGPSASLPPSVPLSESKPS
jgi:hypothetical protein